MLLAYFLWIEAKIIHLVVLQYELYFVNIFLCSAIFSCGEYLYLRIRVLF